MADRSVEQEIETVLAALGFALVALERGGGRRRPLFRLRVERPGDAPGRSTLTADDCAAISRAVEARLDALAGSEGEYILEVSSPGVERPLTRPEDYDRFAGLAVRLRGFGPLAGRDRQVEGVLRGTQEGDRGVRVVMLERDGGTLRVPIADIAKANLVYRPEDDLSGEGNG